MHSEARVGAPDSTARAIAEDQAAATGAGQGEPAGRIALLGEVAHRDSAFSMGGTGANLLRLAHGLRNSGWQVDLVTANRRRLAAFGDELHASVDAFDLGERGRAYQTLGLLAYILRQRPDVLVAQDSRAMDLALTVKLWLPRAFAVVCAMHNPANLCCSDTGAGSIRLQSRFRRVARRADALLAVSPGLLEAACDRFLGASHPKAIAIPNPAYRREAAEAAMANPRNRPVAGEPHLVFAGRLSAQKDPATLIRAAALLEQRHGRPFQLSVLGEGPMRDELQALAGELGIGDRVHFRGFVPDPMAYMADADVLAVPSVEEAFGYVLVEALAVGLPVVSTDCPYGPRYILDDGRYGHLVPVGDAASMADTIARTLDEPTDRDRLIARAREFDSIEIACRYGELFTRLISERRPRR
jgi:glycosyltransferase involved in cell wall biosynthesis